VPPTTDPLSGGTPILNREAPLAQPSPGSRLPFILGTGLCLVLLALLILWRPSFVDSLHRQFEELFPGPWPLSRIVFVALVSVLIGFSVTAVHELGHLIVGVCVGFRCSSMFLGPLQFNAPFRISLNPDRRSWWHGGVTLVPEGADRLRAAAMVFAGPGVNLLTGTVVLQLPYEKGYFSWLFIAASLLAGVIELFLPIRGPTFVFDGLRIWMLFLDPKRGDRWLAVMRLIADVRDGVSPESMSADLLAKATAVRDESTDTVIAHAFGYSTAFHRHHDTEAAQMLEICLRYADRAAPAMRQGLMSDAAVFQARRRKRPDLADQWLAKIPVDTPHRWFRSRAEAAILEARRDVAGALRKLADVEAALLALPNNPQRDTLLRLLDVFD
jgi:hypothetical protein